MAHVQQNPDYTHTLKLMDVFFKLKSGRILGHGTTEKEPTPVGVSSFLWF